jgi:uncharacterized cupredoxin-like copper-binding protein
MTTRFAGRRLAALAVLPLLVFAACGDDDDTAAGNGNGDGEEAAGVQEYCDASEELDEGDGPPTDEQFERLKQLAPAEIRDDVVYVADAFIAAEGDFGAAFADPEVGVRLANIEQWEVDACGREPDLPDGVTTEIDEDAQRVDVSATEYDFTFDPPSAGAVSFVMSNDGEEAHYMGIGKLRDGVTLEEALEADDPDEVTEWTADSLVAGPGGEAVLTVEDLEPGEYGMVCFLPAPDGTPHAFLGMAVPFTVTE